MNGATRSQIMSGSFSPSISMPSLTGVGRSRPFADGAVGHRRVTTRCGLARVGASSRRLRSRDHEIAGDRRDAGCTGLAHDGAQLARVDVEDRLDAGLAVGSKSPNLGAPDTYSAR